MQISVVIPAFDEAESLPALLRRLLPVLGESADQSLRVDVVRGSP